MYLYRNRNRLASRIEERRRIFAEAAEGANVNNQTPRGRSSRGRRSHYSDMDRKVLEDAIASLPHPSQRESRTLTQLWGQLAAEASRRFADPTDFRLPANIYCYTAPGTLWYKLAQAVSQASRGNRPGSSFENLASTHVWP